jgi:hypothetical protein
MAYRYTNGVDHLLVLPVLRDRLLWYSDRGTDGSKSGRYFDDQSFHALVDEEVFKNIQNDKWRGENDFATVKQKFSDAAIIKALNAVFDTPEIVEQTLTHDISEVRISAVMPDAGFVGFEIVIPPEAGHALKAVNAVFHFNDNAEVILKAYSQGDEVPFLDKLVSVVGGKYHIEPLEDWILSYPLRKSAKFFIGYHPSEISGSGLPFTSDIINCLPSYFFAATPVYSDNPITESSVRYPSGAIGLGLELQTFRDFTSSVVLAPSLWDELVGLIHASMILEQILFSQRSNPEQRQALENQERFSIQLDLTGTLPISDAPQILGMRSRIDKQVNRLKSIFHKKQTGVVSYADY